MNLKSLIKIIGSLAFSAPACLSVSACQNNSSYAAKENNLNNLSALTFNNQIIVNNSSNYFLLNSVIVNAKVFINHPLAIGYTINWYYKEKNNYYSFNPIWEHQTVNTVYVKIKAATSDKYWKGATKLLPFALAKQNLNTIKLLTYKKPFILNNKDSYSKLDSFITTANEFNNNPLNGQYKIDWFYDVQGKKPLDQFNTLQKTGTVYIQISAVNHPYLWTGTSNILAITITSK